MADMRDAFKKAGFKEAEKQTDPLNSTEPL